MSFLLVFFPVLKPEFSWTSINCFYGFLTNSDRDGSLIAVNEGGRLTRIISIDDRVFNFYFIKMKDYIAKTKSSLRAE